MSATPRISDLTVRLVNDASGFEALESDWNRLSGDVPFRNHRWHRTWWHHFGGEHKLLILAVYDQETCVGIAPLFVQRVFAAGRVAQFLGSGVVASDQQTILADSGDTEDVGRAVARWFASEKNMHADLLQLDGIDVTCPAFAAFSSAAKQNGYSLVDRSTLHTWRIALPANTDAYLAMLSKSCRRKIRTAMKRFESGELNVSIANDKATFQQTWDCFVDLHQRRRESQGEDDSFADTTFTGFLHDIAGQFFDAGNLDMVCVSSNEGPIATEICFRSRTCSYAYQIGINPDSLKDNPGWLVNAASIQRAIELGLTHFDFCRGDFDYKRQMGADPIVCQRLRIVPPRFRSQVLGAVITQGTAMRNFLQSRFSVTSNQS
ncbi:MAG: GNAT family N-acetyltransferase [Pirellulaceae bacterium]